MESYVAVRAHGLKSRLLRRHDYEALARGDRGIYEFEDYSAIADRDPLDVKIEKVYRVYVSRISLLARVAPDLAEYFWGLSDRLEFENLKLQLRRLLGGRGRPLLYPYGRHVGPAKLSGTRSEEELWELAASSGLVSEAPRRKWSSLAEREAFIDFAYLSRFTSTVLSIPASRESKRALQRVAEELCSLAAAKWGRFLSFEVLASVARAANLKVRSAASDVSPTQKLLAMARELELRYYASLPYTFAFNVYALFEAENVVRVIVGRSLGMESSKILANLVFTL